jgi:hypothetical protein
MSGDNQTTLTVCGRTGCGVRMACCRPDCPIVMIDARDGGWYWETREEVRRQMQEVTRAGA